MSPVHAIGLLLIIAGAALITWGLCEAATLEMVGSATGSGMASLGVSGDWINASGNATAWHIIAGGWAA